MKIVPIPPTSWIPNVKDFAYHFALTHVCETDREYVRQYAMIGEDQNKFLILDNGAFENGSSDPMERLKYWIDILHPQEVVLPDRMFMMDETIRMSGRAIDALQDTDVDVMGVPHGRNIDEWYQCMKRLLNLGADTIGIAKDYEAWHGGRNILLQLVPDNFPVHLLGQESDLLAISQMDHDEKIRSVDTAKPFIYAFHGDAMHPHDENVKSKGRPDEYFSLQEDQLDESLVWNNLLTWATIADDQDALMVCDSRNA